MSLSLLQGKRFFCREWAFAKIAHCLENRATSKTCGALIMGGPGCGKTALCCELVSPTAAQGKQLALSRRVLVYHFCQAHDTDTLSLVEFIHSLVRQISESSLVSGYNDLIKNQDIQTLLEPQNILLDPDESFRKALLIPLVEADLPKQNCFFLVDSIDESFFHSSVGINSTAESNKINNGTSRTIAELLANHHHLFPRWLLLVCSARKQSKSVTKMFTGFRKISLDDLRKSHVVHDVQQYILCRLDQEPRLRQHLSRETAEMLNQLHIKSNGCFLYLEKVLDGVAENFIMLREIREIPGTLNGLYLWLCQRLFVRKQFGRVQPILNAVLAARKPLTTEQLYHCVWTRNTLLTWTEFQKRFNLLSKVLIDGRNETKILFHHSFAEWLLDVKHCTQKYLCHASEGHGMLAMRYTLKAQRLDDEEVLDFALHLSKINVLPPLQPFHLPLWLILCRAPVQDVLANSWQPITDPRITKLLIEAGAKVTESPQDQNFKRKQKDGATVIVPEDPLDALLATGGDINQTDSNQRTLLHTAAHNGDAELVERLIFKNASLEIIDKNGQTALNLASRQGHAEVVKALLKAKANPDHADNDGWTPLRSSAWAGHTEVVNALLESGAEVDLSDADQRTALRAAAWGGHEEIVLKLLEHGACVNQEDNEGRTALIAAAYMGHTEIVEHLLEHGAEINHEDADGRTALSVAALCVPASEGHAGVVSLLLECGAEVDHRDKDGMTPLLVAAFEGHSEVCELLLEGDADVDHTDNNNRTPLFAAASMGHPAVVNLLLFWGAAIDTIDSEGRTVLSIATAQGNSEVVRQLLDRGLDEMHRDNAGWTPLHYAAFEGHQDACEILIEAGARITEVDNDGRIPLILSAQEGHTQLVGRLLKYNHSMVDIKSHDGKTAFRVAALEGHKETVGLLIAEGADFNYRDADGRSTLYLLALENRLEMADFLLSHHADVDARDLEGRTALHVSAWQGHYDMVDLLLAHGANVNAVDNDQRTALQSASWQGHGAVVRLLLERRAHVDHTCNQGATALCIAAQEGHEEVVLVLLEYGANPNHADQFGRNPLRVATKGNHGTVIRILEEFASQAAEFGRSTHCHGSTSTTSLTSASTAETKPCSAILCQPGVTTSNNETLLLESPTSTGGGNRRSFVSNHSSSRSSSNLTTSTNKSTQQLPQTVIENRTLYASGNPNQIPHQQLTAIPQPNAPQIMTFTQQLQQCTRNRNRASRVLSPLSEPQNSPVPSPPQSPLSEVLSQRLSPVSLSPQGNSGNSPHHAHVPIVINPPNNQPSTQNRSTQQIDTAIPRPPEPKFRRNGIVTNPNYKGGYVKMKEPIQSHTSYGGPTGGGSKIQIEKNKQNSSNVMPIYEEAIKLPIKKETPL